MNYSSVKIGRVVELVTEPASDVVFQLGLESVESNTGRLLEASGIKYSGAGVGFVVGDVLFGKLRPYLAKAWLADRAGAAVGDFHVYRPFADRLDSKYFSYCILADTFLSPVTSSVHGAKMPRAGWSFVRDVEICLPSLGEQCAIADYLDRETQQIDELIAEQTGLIETLRERRAARISSSVLGVSLPDVGADRPEVGDQWVWVPFLRAMVERIDYRGATPVKTDEGVRLITARNVREGYIDYDHSVEYVGTDDYQKVMRRGLPEVDDLLFTMEAPLGNIALIDNPGVALAQRIVKFRIDPRVAIPRFAMYQMLGMQFQAQLYKRATGSTALGIKASKLSGLSLALPSLKQQREIAAYLDDQTSRIDELISESEDLISLSQERRAALITAAVTGQIDVRTAA